MTILDAGVLQMIKVGEEYHTKEGHWLQIIGYEGDDPEYSYIAEVQVNGVMVKRSYTAKGEFIEGQKSPEDIEL